MRSVMRRSTPAPARATPTPSSPAATTATGSPTPNPAGCHRWASIASATATTRLDAALATASPRRTSRYRAPRRTSTGTAITRCLTTAYANESGISGNASSAHAPSQSGTEPTTSTTAMTSVGAIPTTVPHARTRALRRTSEDAARAACPIRARIPTPIPRKTFPNTP